MSGKMMIETVEDAKRLKARLQTDHRRLVEWRRVRDRRMDNEGGVLDTLARALAEPLQAAFVPYQSAEPEFELMRRKHILVSNPVEIEVISKSGDRQVVELAQRLEEADEAILEALFPMTVQLLECDALLGDDRVVLALDKLPPPSRVAEYADRRALEEYAEAEGGDDDGEEDTPRGRYRAAYRRTGSHTKAYADVYDDAARDGPLRYRVRVVDGATFDCFEDEDGVAIGMETGRVPLAPTLQALQGYGLRQEGDRIVLTREGESTGEAAAGWPVIPEVDTGEGDSGDLETIEYTQIRTRTECVMLLEHPRLEDESGARGAALIRYPNFFAPKSTGYYVAYGVEKLRGTREDRSVPPILGLLVEAQLEAVVVSAWSAMALEEAMREPYVARPNQPAVTALDPTQQPTVAPARRGAAPVVQGEILRPETTGVKMAELREWVHTQLDRYRSREFFSGSGSSSETGIHLARLQTAYLTEMQPFQVKRAELRKRILLDIHHATAMDGLTLYVPWVPTGSRHGDEGVRVAEPREITAEMARLPVDIRVTIGAESPETKYAREQASRAEVDFGARSLLTHMETTGVKDPAFELKRIAKSSIIRDALVGAGGEPGWAVTMVRSAIEQRVQAWLDAKFPPPVAGPPVADAGALPADEGTGPGVVPPGAARFTPAVQTDPQTGAPVAPGLPGLPV